jgi:hypothetical protein
LLEAGVAVTENCVAVNINVAVTVESMVSGIEQGSVPTQLVAFPEPLLQPANVEPLSAIAVRSTLPWAN